MNPASQGLEADVLHSQRKWFRRLTIVAVIASFLLAPALFAQDGVPDEMLRRTLFIKVGNEGGTAFALDYKGKIYLVTAKHVVAGLSPTGATIQVWQSNRWVDYKTVKILFPPSNDADIAVLETTETVAKPFEITVPQGKEGVTFGQQVWFLGYPHGLGTRDASGLSFCFIKRGTMSAIDSTDPNAVILYIDGFNNPGFSGGPIVYFDHITQAYRILGVVKGYKNENARVIVNGVEQDTQLLVNSGILVGYSIQHALQAIDPNQKQP
jgi:S1-C subfamily serine protease